MSPEPIGLLHPGTEPTPTPRAEVTSNRLTLVVEREFDFVWRSLRRLGIPAGAVDDAAQQVWLVLARRLPEIAEGSERAFLFGTARRIASDTRRRMGRQREVPGLETAATIDPAPGAEELLGQQQARLLLDEVLEALPDDLREVFILYELEEQTGAEISDLLALPPGTVASRLRRARVEFEQIVKRLRARGRVEGSR